MHMQFTLETIADAVTEEQAKQLAKLLAARFPSIVTMYMPFAGSTDNVPEEQTEFTVTLTAFEEDRERVLAIKQMRKLRPDLDLPTSIKLLNGVRENISIDFAQNVSKRSADHFAEQLQAVGFTVKVW